ncbi:glycosyltransferase family 9 protein [Hydrogenimonas sp.]
MRILVELPTWLGDAVMATPALENLFLAYPEASVTVVGSYVATEALKAHPRIERVVVDRTKAGGWRPLNLYRLAKELGRHDLAISFRSHPASKLLLFLTRSQRRALFDKKGVGPGHQVEKYQRFINDVTGRNDTPGALKLYWPPKRYDRPTLGINPGATYGSAKRWYPEKFAETAAAFADRFEILIFGGPGERDIAGDIERALRSEGVSNLHNLAGETTIPQLCEAIGGLDLFITGDSGPMHIAAAYRVPTVAIFGPTRDEETSQWMNPKSVIVRKEVDCAPCMKRTCPIKTHACMRDITPQQVFKAAKELLEP